MRVRGEREGEGMGEGVIFFVEWSQESVWQLGVMWRGGEVDWGMRHMRE